MRKRPVIYWMLPMLLLAIVIIYRFSSDRSTNETDSFPKEQQKKDQRPPSDANTRPETFNRRTSNLIFTKHARCRMACRQIDETEVREILEKGIINYSKSDPAARPDPKYALEGRTHDNQQVRIVFAPTDKGMVVITCIDLEREWKCDCK